MKIFVVHRLEDQDGTNSFPIIAYTNKKLAIEKLSEEYIKTVKSFQDNEEKIKYDFYSFNNEKEIWYKIWNDTTSIYLTIEEIELEGSLFVLNELNQLEEDCYNENVGIFTDKNEAWIKANSKLNEAEEQLGSCERNNCSVSTSNTIVTESVTEIKL